MAPDRPTVLVEGDCVTISGLHLCDRDLTHFITGHDEGQRGAIVERALEIGLIALCNAGVTVNVDHVQREFERLLHRIDESNEAASEALARSLRETFADTDGRLPRTLEQFLGDRGTLRRLVEELFDGERRDSAIGRIRTLLGGYFDGDGAILARLLDPTREGSPLHGFRGEVREGLAALAERLTRLEAGRAARAAERAIGTAKGGDFEDALCELARAHGDILERTTKVIGDSVSELKGDFVLHLTRGSVARIAIETKGGPIRLAKLTRQLDGARRNRSAGVAVGVCNRDCAPRGSAPLTLHGSDVICEFDPDDPGGVGLDAAIRLARAMALVCARQESPEVDAGAIHRQLDTVGNRIRDTSIGTVAGEVATSLDALRGGALDCVAAIETELRCADAQQAQAVVA